MTIVAPSERDLKEEAVASHEEKIPLGKTPVPLLLAGTFYLSYAVAILSRDTI